MSAPEPHDDERWSLDRPLTPRQRALLRVLGGGLTGWWAFCLLVFGEPQLSLLWFFCAWFGLAKLPEYQRLTRAWRARRLAESAPTASIARHFEEV